MGKQTIIALSREYGSGGHEIAEKLSKRLNLPFYDRNLLDSIALEKNVSGIKLQQYDEKPRNRLLSRTIRGESNSPEEIIANMQFDYIKKKAHSGESFVIVGRCAEHVLKGYEGLITIFILGDIDARIKRVEDIRDVDAKEAEAIINRHDKKRKSYHNYHCDSRWGDSRGYDVTMNSTRLGVDATIDVLEDYIRRRMEI